MTYYSDYPSKPIGRGNPYWQCSSCLVSDPEINGRIEGHHIWCEWRKKKEIELGLFLSDQEILDIAYEYSKEYGFLEFEHNGRDFINCVRDIMRKVNESASNRS